MKKGNLLIVDDEPHLVKVLEFSLKKFAENIYSAGNGPDALAILRAKKIDCVLCDLNLPRMSGLEIIREMRSQNFHMPFLFFTADHSREIFAEAARFGALDFFIKPKFEGIEAAVCAALHEGRSIPRPDSDYGKVLAEMGIAPGRFLGK